MLVKGTKQETKKKCGQAHARKFHSVKKNLPLAAAADGNDDDVIVYWIRVANQRTEAAVSAK
jgi:hypothetical protein